MRKLLFLFVLLLTGCGLMATPTPTRTPRPTATPTEEIRYLPTASNDTGKAIHGYFSNLVRFPVYQTEPLPRITISSLVSTGETGEMSALAGGETITADYLMAYDYLYLGYVVPVVKVIYGLQWGDEYFYLLEAPFWSGESYSREQAQKDAQERFHRGAVLGVAFYGEGFVSRDLRIDWDKCASVFREYRADSTFICDVGKELEQKQPISGFTQRTVTSFRDDWAVLGLLLDYQSFIQLP
ncbi:MAG: hypothetical protein ACPLUL_12880 [Thermanaerothrix sp.]|jgi:hypothetical protein|uniref:hypothetical protein n=1 Tax=Thermanaerothrix sp. TaxID=2972675 RepID=UPI003C7E11EB